MPIGGFIINIDPENSIEALESLSCISHLEVHGSDDQGNIVAVLDTETSKEMQKIVDDLNKLEFVLTVGLTYINVEDEGQSVINTAGHDLFHAIRDTETEITA
jgi:periplasmic nitrate reductase NapD